VKAVDANPTAAQQQELLLLRSCDRDCDVSINS